METGIEQNVHIEQVDSTNLNELSPEKPQNEPSEPLEESKEELLPPTQVENNPPQVYIKDEPLNPSQGQPQPNTMEDVFMSIEKRLEVVNQLKDDAKPFFQNKNYTEAIRLYSEALAHLKPEFFQMATDIEIRNFVSVANLLYSNMSLCYFNMGDYRVSIEWANQVMYTDPQNTQILFRLAVNYQMLQDWDRAYQYIQEAVKINNALGIGNNNINEEYTIIREEYIKYKDKYREKEKELYKQMFASDIDKEEEEKKQGNATTQPNKDAKKSQPQSNQKQEQLQQSDQDPNDDDLQSQSSMRKSGVFRNERGDFDFQQTTGVLLGSTTAGLLLTTLLCNGKINSKVGMVGASALSLNLVSLMNSQKPQWKYFFGVMAGVVATGIFKFAQSISN